ncbi:hypothetical protein WN944_029519 [Citrus x changshan-huyou]|uniref:Cytochrome P450 n=1 Tax=Citrus x changshan-huyou TaxID=2935761 RepID=A0AAP0Q9W7_9ROSI
MALSSLYKRRKAGSEQQPPGPTPYPVIGNLLELGDKPHKSLAKLAKIHGPIMTLKFGQVTTVVVSSASMAKAILQNHDSSFCNRMVPDAACSYNHQEIGMVWLPVSTPWKNLRKICNLHIFSSHKLDANQDIRRKKIKHLLAYVEENCRVGQAIVIGQAVFNTSLNVLSNTIFSVDLVDPTAREFKDIVWGIRRRMTIHYSKIFEVFDRLIDQRLDQRQEHGYNTSTESSDVLDTLLNIRQDKSVEIDGNDIKHLLLDLFVAGADTTSSTLEWAMAELLHGPEALSKARLELEQTIGWGKPLEESDITRLPYLQAVLKETFRDESTWDNPLIFMPERFLGSDLDVKGRNFELIPFGAGRRICPGLPLAIRMLHIMLGSLINSFDWKLEHEKMDMEEKFGITLQKAQPLRAVPIAI